MLVLKIGIGAVAVVALFLAVLVINRYVTMRANEVMEVNSWFFDRMLLHSPQSLTPDEAAVVRSMMDDDTELWINLKYRDKEVDRTPYYDQVIEFGRYLRVFDSSDLPLIHYGVFDREPYGDVAPLFLVWIEFKHQSETAWTLAESGRDHRIVRYVDFRAVHPGLIYRRGIQLVLDEED